MDKTNAGKVFEYVLSLSSLAETIESVDGYGSERDARFAAIPGLAGALAALETESGREARDGHVFVRCEQGDCGEEFLYCEEGNHFCPYCGESGEDAPEANAHADL